MTNAHSSSLTSLGYGFRLIFRNYHIRKFITGSSGRPLFIFQFAIIQGLKGSLEEALKFDIKQSKSAIEFLYGRIYDYLSKDAKNVFVAMKLLATNEDLSNLLDKVKFILNLEHREDEFKVAVDELVKLRIIEVRESDFFYIYSKEILQIMTDLFEKRDSSFKGSCISRLNLVGRDKKLDNEHALLQNADASRLSKNEEEVISSYRQILNRATSPERVKLQAVLNLAAYLFNDRGKKENAIQVLNEFSYMFIGNSSFSKTHAVYYWSSGRREDKRRALNILLDFSSRNTGGRDEESLELKGLLLTYRAIFYIDEREELKSRRKYKEISDVDYDRIYAEQTNMFNEIYRSQGKPLFEQAKKVNIFSMSPATKQNRPLAKV